MTEAEAKMKWCPHVRLIAINNLAVFNNRIGDSKSIETLSRIVKGDSTEIISVAGLTMCIASECMAWRWGQTIDGPVVETRPMFLDDGSVFKVTHNEGWRVKKPAAREGNGGELERVELIKTGYCGLSGKP